MPIGDDLPRPTNLLVLVISAIDANASPIGDRRYLVQTRRRLGSGGTGRERHSTGSK
jgi:hypothetical protein